MIIIKNAKQCLKEFKQLSETEVKTLIAKNIMGQYIMQNISAKDITLHLMADMFTIPNDEEERTMQPIFTHPIYGDEQHTRRTITVLFLDTIRLRRD